MKGALPRVSIGVAVYNGERYLADTLESLRVQTHEDFEVLISDNGSTDATRDICRQYVASDRRFRYSSNRQNLGVARNCNRVFELSSGEFFKWADYDDILEPECLERCVDVLDERPDVVLCYPRVVLIDENGRETGAYDPGPKTGAAPPHVRFTNLILFPELAVQSMGLMRAAAIRRTTMHGSYPSSDEVFLAELALIGQFFEIEERLLRVRRHEAQSTRGALTVQRSRVLFFDTSLQGKIVLPKWRYLGGCLKAIRRACVSAYCRWYCYTQMVRWMARPPNARALGRDVLLASGAWLSTRRPAASTRTSSGGGAA